MSFKSLNLSAAVLRGIEAAGYTEPSPIQLRAIPAVLEGRDVIGSAQTGTGKTAAFALPVITNLAEHLSAPRVLVLEPTRELAAQVDASFRTLGRFTKIRSTAIFGGVGYGAQRAALRDGVDVLVATPGRLMDYLKEGTINLRTLEVLILDEVDHMLDMGFLPVVKDIISRCPKQRQTLFFSATVPPEIAAVAAFALRDPVRVEVGISRSVNQSVSHGIYKVGFPQKFEFLEALLKRTEFDSALIFSRTKHGADKIARRLKSAGHTVAVLHANRSQNQRIEALAGFKSGKYEVMVATDIAARGIDVASVSHVINYDVPEKPEDYVHRIGRTGRAQAIGDAFTLVTPENLGDLRDIERFIGRKIPELTLEGFSYGAFEPKPTSTEPAGPRGPRPGRGGGGGGQRPASGRNPGGPRSGGNRFGGNASSSRPSGAGQSRRAQSRNPR